MLVMLMMMTIIMMIMMLMCVCVCVSCKRNGCASGCRFIACARARFCRCALQNAFLRQLLFRLQFLNSSEFDLNTSPQWLICVNTCALYIGLTSEKEHLFEDKCGKYSSIQKGLIDCCGNAIKTHFEKKYRYLCIHNLIIILFEYVRQNKQLDLFRNTKRRAKYSR